MNFINKFIDIIWSIFVFFGTMILTIFALPMLGLVALPFVIVAAFLCIVVFVLMTSILAVILKAVIGIICITVIVYLISKILGVNTSKFEHKIRKSMHRRAKQSWKLCLYDVWVRLPLLPHSNTICFLLFCAKIRYNY